MSCNDGMFWGGLRSVLEGGSADALADALHRVEALPWDERAQVQGYLLGKLRERLQARRRQVCYPAHARRRHRRHGRYGVAACASRGAIAQTRRPGVNHSGPSCWRRSLWRQTGTLLLPDEVTFVTRRPSDFARLFSHWRARRLLFASEPPFDTGVM